MVTTTCIVSVRVERDAPCGDIATTHLLVKSGCGRWGIADVCRRHALDLAGRARAFVDKCEPSHQFAHVADHPLTTECHHPDGEWVRDRCRVGLVDTDRLAASISVGEAS